MKNLRKASAFSLFVFLSVAAVGCTGQADPAGETTTGASPTAGSASPESAPKTSDIFEAQASVLKNGSPSSEIRQQVTGAGTTSFDVEPMPPGYSHLGVAVQCSGTGKWSASLDGVGGKEVSSDCSLNGGAAGLFDISDPAASQTVIVKVADGTDIWVTIFADSHDEADK
ncbi:hypothetical protein ACPROK_11880 [Glutamicibacter soli]|uniref:hypothetical protein n=1 Tax=Glutamicibacter soli TaxID=453836 RepID=UPI003C7108ED